MKKYLKRFFKFLIYGIPEVTVRPELKVLAENNSLSGKTILITGGNRGLGLSIAKRCISSGAKVIISARNENSLLQAKAVLGNECSYVTLDLSKKINFSDFFDSKSLKNVDTLVLNAGVSLHEQSFLDVTEAGWDTQFDVNLKANFFLAQQFIKCRRGKSLTKLLFISSERGFIPDDVPYGLTKTALNSLVRGLSNVNVSNGFIVNAIAPGVTASDMTGYMHNDNLYRVESYGHRVFLPEEISEVAWFLISDLSNSISGEVIACDHGSYLKRK